MHGKLFQWHMISPLSFFIWFVLSACFECSRHVEKGGRGRNMTPTPPSLLRFWHRYLHSSFPPFSLFTHLITNATDYIGSRKKSIFCLPATPNLPNFAGQLVILCPVSVLVSVSLFSSEVMLFNKGSPVIHYSCVCLYVRKRRRTHAKKLTSVHPFHFPFSPLFYSDKKRGGRKSRWRKREYVAKRGKGRKELAKFKLILVTCISRGTNRELPPKVTRVRSVLKLPRVWDSTKIFLFKTKQFVWRKIMYFRKWQMKTRRSNWWFPWQNARTFDTKQHRVL